MSEAREVIQIRLSDQERSSGVMDPANLVEALVSLHRDGIVVLNNAIDVAHIDKINARMASDAVWIYPMSDTHFNGTHETGNFTQYPTVFPEYMYEDVFCNKMVAKVLNNILGPNPELRFINGNTAMNGTERQGVHADLDFDDHLDFPFAFTVNFYLCDTSPANGMTEWWPGTHHRGNKNIRKLQEKLTPYILDEEIEKRRKICPPVRPTIPRGSVVIRDLRIWHAGVPNETDVPRIMFGWIYFAAWYQNKQRTIFPESVRKFIEQWSGDLNMLAAADFVPDDKFDILHVEFAPDYSGAGRGLQIRDDPIAPEY